MAQDFILPTATNHLRQRRENSPLLPFREPTGNPMLYKAIAQNSATLSAYQQSLQMLNDRVSRCERRASIDTTFTQTAIVAPFQIYQPGVVPNGVSVNSGGSGGYTLNQVLTVSGGTVAPGGSAATITVGLVDASGNLLACTLTSAGSYTVQPTYPAALSAGAATVTILSAADDWRTVQIGAGMVSARSAYNPLATGQPYPIVGADNSQTDVAWQNGEWVFYLDLDDVASNYFYEQSTSVGNYEVVTLPPHGAAKTLIYGYLPDGTFVQYGQIVLDPGVAGSAEASFWIEIVDDVTKGFYVNVYATMVVAEDAFIPSGPNVLGIGWILANQTSGPSGSAINQIATGNLTNRWASMNITPAGTSPAVAVLRGLPMVFRGYWSFDNLSGQMFYNGDVVIDDSQTLVIQGSTSTVYQIYQYYGGYNTESDSINGPPHENGTRWSYCGSKVIP